MGCLKLRPFCLIRFMLVMAAIFQPLHAPAAPSVGTRFLQQDHRGDVTVLSGSAGRVLETHRYRAWGNSVDLTDLVGVRPGFTGRERDFATGLDYLNARYFDSSLGRFLSPDPIGQFRSAYLYASDSPLEYVDPTGKGGELLFSFESPFRFLDNSEAPRLIVGQSDPRFFDRMRALRRAYYFRASVLLKEEGEYRVYTPTTRFNTRREDYVFAIRLREGHVPRAFTTSTYKDWMEMNGDDQSVVALHVDHGVVPWRVDIFQKEIRPYSSSFSACLDIGCRISRSNASPDTLRNVSDIYTGAGITYISSDQRVHTASLTPHKKLLAQLRARAPWNKNRTLLVDNYVATSISKGAELDQSWQYIVPFGKKRRVQIHTAPGLDTGKLLTNIEYSE